MPRLHPFITIKFRIFAAIPQLIVLVFLVCSCSKKGDGTIDVPSDDPEMVAAMAHARATLPEFWNVFEHHPKGEREFALKVKVTDKHGTEFFWLVGIERRDGKMFGTINNDPDIVDTVKNGQRIEIPDADIADWLYLRDQRMVGNFTIKPLLKRMPAAEAAKYKQMLAEP